MTMRDAESKILTRETLASRIAECKLRGERIVLANGCFDTLHVGHVRYLEGAHAAGDVLVVAINSDSSRNASITCSRL